MFDSKHYVPILKWKPAEQQALEMLSVEKKKFITPLIQIIMPQPNPPKKGEKRKSPEEQLEETIENFKVKIKKIPEEILKYWGKTPVFIDFSLIYASPLRIEGLDKVLKIGEKLGIILIPVVNLSSDQKTKKIASSLTKKYGHGLCLRLGCADLIDIVKLSQEIKILLTTIALSEKDVDLLVDLKNIYEGDNKYIEFRDLSQKIPSLSKWRTFIFASGAFPTDLTDFMVGENYIPRLDWNNWIAQINSKKLQREPSFADYTIQHPIYKLDLQFFPPSASIRYTLDNRWLIMRGQRRKSKQYLANAQLLSQNPNFFGADFSYGDRYIAEKGKNLKSEKTGNAKTWLGAGINHHLACTASQIANLP